MSKIKSLLAATVLLAGFSIKAQTNTTGSFYQSAISYFASFNTNLDSTFGLERGEVWTGVDSLQGSATPLANSLGLSYRVSKSLFSVESVTRNGGIAGVLMSEQIGGSISLVVHDAKLTGYVDAGYDFTGASTRKVSDRLFGEIGLRVSKALTEHTFAGVGVGARFPDQSQSFSAFVGFTF